MDNHSACDGIGEAIFMLSESECVIMGQKVKHHMYDIGIIRGGTCKE